MPAQDTCAWASVPAGRARGARERVRIVHSAATKLAQGQSVRATAAAEGVPASTLYHYLARAAAVDAPAGERDFFSSPCGQELLQRIVVALHLVVCQAGGCGVDRVAEFLDLTGLDHFVAASHGYQHGVAVAIERLLGEYGDAQRARLGPGMPAQSVVLCEDETFHPAMCLVAIAAESDMILLESYSETRDGATWSALVEKAVADLPVKVAMVVGDGAKGLIAHAREGLGCHFGPDLFHPQHDISKATARPLAARLTTPQAALTQAEDRTAHWRKAKADYQEGPRGPGRPTNFDRYIAEAQATEDLARETLAATLRDQAAVRAANRSLSEAYHPFDLVSGATQTAAVIQTRFQSAFAIIDEVVGRVGLNERCRPRIDKARRLIPKFVSTMAFFHDRLEATLAALELPAAVLDTVRHQLVPGLYLARAAKKARTAAERAAIAAVSDSLLASARAAGSPFMDLDLTGRLRVEAVVGACLQLFVRSSACVEGRNGHLALQHHGLHRLSDPRLKALTVLHNYYARRPDGTTAAERFFGQKPDDLFAWLLARIEPPALPRARRLREAA